MPWPDHLSYCLTSSPIPPHHHVLIQCLKPHHLSLNSMPRPDHLSYCLYLTTDPYLIIMSLFSVSNPIIWVLTQCLELIICLIASTSPLIPTSSSCPYSVSQTPSSESKLNASTWSSVLLPLPHHWSLPHHHVLIQCLKPHHLSLNSMPRTDHLSYCLYLTTDPYFIIMSLFSVSNPIISLNSMPWPDHLSYCLYFITDPPSSSCPYSVSLRHHQS